MDNSDYPFGFGLKLMKNKRAMEHLFALSDDQKRKWVKELTVLNTEEELSEWITRIAQSEPTSARVRYERP